MEIQDLVSNVPNNVDIVNESARRWVGARVAKMAKSEIRQSDSLWRSPDRWKIVDRDGNNLDSRQGYGYKKPYTAQKKIDSMPIESIK